MRGNLAIAGWSIDYKAIVDKELERASQLHEHGLEAAANAIWTSLQGGDCVHCGIPWRKVHVDNRYAEYERYEPACKCYPTCRRVIKYPGVKGGEFDEGCGRRLYEEYDAGGWTENGHTFIRCNNCRTVICIDGYLARRRNGQRKGENDARS